MSYHGSLFTRKKTIDSRDNPRRKMTLVSQETNKLKELQDQLNLEKQKGIKLQESILKAEESLLRKTEDYEKQIKELRDQIMHSRLHPTPTSENINKNLEDADKLHQTVLNTINDFKLQIEQQIKDQEIDTNKRFDHKLSKICKEIEDRKKKRIMELSSMANTEKKISKDLQTLRESAILVEKKNNLLEQENKSLENQINQKDSYFQELMHQFYYCKKNIKKTLTEDMDTKSLDKTPKLPSFNSHTNDDKTERYETVIGKLRRQLDIERKNLKSIRYSFAQEIDQRTEMENIVRRFVEEIRESQAQKNRLSSSYEERAMLVDKLLNSSDVFNLLNRSPYQTKSKEGLN